MTTMMIPYGMPTGIATRGTNGYWGASQRTAQLTTDLVAALQAGRRDTSEIVEAIGWELAAEAMPTPDQETRARHCA